MFIDAVSDEFDYEVEGIENQSEGTDGQRKYVLLERGDYCYQCFKNPRMQELGIENISFQVYQLAEQKLFTMDFKAGAPGGKSIWFHFPLKTASEKGYAKFLAEVEKIASAKGAVGLATLAHHGAVVAAESQFPPHLDSEYFRCMAGCDKIEFELLKLLCYAICTWGTDDTPGS